MDRTTNVTSRDEHDEHRAGARLHATIMYAVKIVQTSR